jgi:hypothetical protein
MAMRGDDIIAIKIGNPGSKPEFLKGEVKSRVAISALRKNNSRPSPHALRVVAVKVRELKCLMVDEDKDGTSGRDRASFAGARALGGSP